MLKGGQIQVFHALSWTPPDAHPFTEPFNGSAEFFSTTWWGTRLSDGHPLVIKFFWADHKHPVVNRELTLLTDPSFPGSLTLCNPIWEEPGGRHFAAFLYPEKAVILDLLPDPPTPEASTLAAVLFAVHKVLAHLRAHHRLYFGARLCQALWQTLLISLDAGIASVAFFDYSKLEELAPDETGTRLEELERGQIWQFVAAMFPIGDLLKLAGNEMLEPGDVALIEALARFGIEEEFSLASPNEIEELEVELILF
jgi:hypothetical protein